ncbi:CapA family protein [Citricoccus sp. SGAir0253]|uniref:CapA family protein n=1 Tax=Citricoccus sp. SGAir0253 TaxID=2567881 RepID=UPI00143DF65D|nr:CapA family protein [Citricoccus sp. SGAir0253]
MTRPRPRATGRVPSPRRRPARLLATSLLAAGVLALPACAAAPEAELPAGSPGGPGPAPGAPPSGPDAGTDPGPGQGPRTFTLNVSGDLLWHDELWESAELDAARTGRGTMDFLPQLESVRQYAAAADLAVCHAEVPFAPEGGPYRAYPSFAAPPQAARAVAAAGFDVCTTASNHALDAGWQGLVRTLDVHEEAGIGAVGSYRSAREAEAPFVHVAEDGTRVGIVSQTYALNGIPHPAGREWSVPLLDAEAAIADARAARAAGAEIVAVHLHAGSEYVTAPNAEQVAFVEEVTASGAVDVVFGQHAHSVQPVDVVNGVWVVYGTGNLLAHQELGAPHSYDGAMVELTFTEGRDGRFAVRGAEYAPTLITPLDGDRPARVLVIPFERADHPGLAGRMDASAARTRQAIRSLDVEGLAERTASGPRAGS